MGASKGDAAASMLGAIAEQLKVKLGEELQPVTYRWLAYDHACSAALAKHALRLAAAEWADSCAVTYCVTGAPSPTAFHVRSGRSSPNTDHCIDLAGGLTMEHLRLVEHLQGAGPQSGIRINTAPDAPSPDPTSTLTYTAFTTPTATPRC